MKNEISGLFPQTARNSAQNSPYAGTTAQGRAGERQIVNLPVLPENMLASSSAFVLDPSTGAWAPAIVDQDFDPDLKFLIVSAAPGDDQGAALGRFVTWGASLVFVVVAGVGTAAVFAGAVAVVLVAWFGLGIVASSLSGGRTGTAQPEDGPIPGSPAKGATSSYNQTFNFQFHNGPGGSQSQNLF
jgi:hypothetical protein